MLCPVHIVSEIAEKSNEAAENRILSAPLSLYTKKKEIYIRNKDKEKAHPFGYAL